MDFDLQTAVLALHVLVGMLFVGLGVQNFMGGRELGLVLNGLLGLLIVVSVSVAALFYILVIWASGRALPGAVLVESSLPAAAAMEALFSSALIGKIMALAGIAGILTSWNSFLLGGSRAIYALAESGMLPETLATVNENTDTPSRALALIGGLSVFAPLFGEQMLVWIVNAGGFGIVVAWVMVVISFLVLRVREPEMDRPLKLPAGKAVGVLALALTLVFTGMYLPGAPSALQWPFEWGIVLLWVLLGAGLVVQSRLSGRETHVDAHGFDGD
jgi:amino acid transporter